jgi:hypothetical protein
MGRRSEVEVNERREAVLALLRREEPAALVARRVKMDGRWSDRLGLVGHQRLKRDSLHRRYEPDGIERYHRGMASVTVCRWRRRDARRHPSPSPRGIAS